MARKGKTGITYGNISVYGQNISLEEAVGACEELLQKYGYPVKEGPKEVEVKRDGESEVSEDVSSETEENDASEEEENPWRKKLKERQEEQKRDELEQAAEDGQEEDVRTAKA